MVMIQTSGKRIVIAVVIALLLALAPAVFAQVMIPDPCRGLTPSDWEYWIKSCWMFPAIQAFFGGLTVSPMVIR